MFSHVMLGADDIDKSKAFYDAILGALGIGPGMQDPNGRVFWITPTGIFAITKPIDGQAASCGNGSTVGFAADATDKIDAWHAAGVANGGTSIEDPPGVRANAAGDLYLAYLRDPSGNKICAMKRM